MLKNLRYRFAVLMQGRYGTDQLSRFLSLVVIILIVLDMIANSFLAFPGIRLFVRISGIIYTILLFVIYFRTFSRNILKRYAENQKYLAFKERISSFFGKSRHNAGQRIEYHIYKCPNCGQKIRIPQGKGRIVVRCPKCSTEFMKQS